MGSGDRGRGGESAADSNNNQSPARAPGCTLVFTALIFSLYYGIHCTLVFTALQYLLQSSIYCTLVFTSLIFSLYYGIHCTLVFAALQYSLHSSIHCTYPLSILWYSLHSIVFTALQYSLHSSSLYIMVFTALQYSLHFRIHCTLVFTVLQYLLHLADLLTTALLVFCSIRCTIKYSLHFSMPCFSFAQVLKVPKIYFTLALSELQYSLHSIFFSLQNSLCSLFTVRASRVAEGILDRQASAQPAPSIIHYIQNSQSPNKGGPQYHNPRRWAPNTTISQHYHLPFPASLLASDIYLFAVALPVVIFSPKSIGRANVMYIGFQSCKPLPGLSSLNSSEGIQFPTCVKLFNQRLTAPGIWHRRGRGAPVGLASLPL